jgi:hypothetical protein
MVVLRRDVQFSSSLVCRHFFPVIVKHWHFLNNGIRKDASLAAGYQPLPSAAGNRAEANRASIDVVGQYQQWIPP